MIYSSCFIMMQVDDGAVWKKKKKTLDRRKTSSCEIANTVMQALQSKTCLWFQATEKHMRMIKAHESNITYVIFFTFADTSFCHLVDESGYFNLGWKTTWRCFCSLTCLACTYCFEMYFLNFTLALDSTLLISWPTQYMSKILGIHSLKTQKTKKMLKCHNILTHNRSLPPPVISLCNPMLFGSRCN